MKPFAFGKTGYVPPKVVDPRNFILETAQPPVSYPPSYKTDLTALPIFNQLQIPDCVENAVVEVKKFHDLKNKGMLYDLSRRSLAIETMAAEGAGADPFSDGTSLQVALNVAHNKGIAESSYCTDDHNLTPEQFIGTPLTAQAVANALMHKITSYAFVTDTSANGLKNAIYQNGLVIIGMHIDDNWWTALNGETSWAAKDLLPLRPPAANSTTESGHCIVLYGYDNDYFYLVNWWSSSWCASVTPGGDLEMDGGYGYFAANVLPTIWEAATIIDLTPEQITALQTTQSQVQQVSDIIPTINPSSPNAAQTVSLLSQVVGILSQIINSIFG
jgi:hypothetical protein